MFASDTQSTAEPPSTPVADGIPTISPQSSIRSESPVPQTPSTPPRHTCPRSSKIWGDSLFTSCGLAYFSPSTEAERVSWELHGGKGEDGGFDNDPFAMEHEIGTTIMLQSTPPPYRAAFVDPDEDDSLILSLARHPISLYRAGWVEDCVAAGELLPLEPYTISKAVILERKPRRTRSHGPNIPSPQIESFEAERLNKESLTPLRSETPVSPSLGRRKAHVGRSPKLQGFKPRLSYVDSPAAAAKLARWHQEGIVSPRDGRPPSHPNPPALDPHRPGYLTPIKTISDSYPGRRHKAEAVHGLLLLSTA